MGSKHRPKAGSMAVYPRVRAKNEKPTFKNMPIAKGEAKPLNFYGYKAGMTTVMAVNEKKGSPSFGQRVALSGTIVEAPAIKVFGLRGLDKNTYGKNVLFETMIEKIDKHLDRRLKGIKRKKSKFDLAGIDKVKDKIKEIRLLCHLQPHLTGIGKKKPEVTEIFLSGNVEEQLNYARDKLGKEISVTEVFEPNEFIDLKAVTKGKGTQGVIKRYSMKIHGRKSEVRRTVGSTGSITPSNVSYRVPRAGQMGYHNRTEYNKKIFMISNEVDKINPKAGFKQFGKVKNDFVLIYGSVPGPQKRCIAMRKKIRSAVRTQKVKSAGVILIEN